MHWNIIQRETNRRSEDNKITNIQYSRKDKVEGEKVVWIQFETSGVLIGRVYDDSIKKRKRKASSRTLYTMDFKLSNGSLISTSLYKETEEQTDKADTRQLLTF